MYSRNFPHDFDGILVISEIPCSTCFHQYFDQAYISTNTAQHESTSIAISKTSRPGDMTVDYYYRSTVSWLWENRDHYLLSYLYDALENSPKLILPVGCPHVQTARTGLCVITNIYALHEESRSLFSTNRIFSFRCSILGTLHIPGLRRSKI